MGEQEDSKIEWCKENTNMLIALYRKKELLWNPTHKDFKNRSKKQDAWVEIAESVETDIEEVERKARTLVGQFQRELKKGKNGDGAEASFKSKWRYFRPLLFLQDKKTPRHLEEVFIEDIQTMENSHDSNETLQTQGSEKQFDNIVQAPKRCKPERVEIREDSTVKETYEAMNGGDTHRGGMKKKDVFDAFGEYIAHCLRNVKSRQLVLDGKFQINNIIYQIEKNDQMLMSPRSNSIPSTSFASPTMPYKNELNER